ncbi:DnaD domain-containing protein [Paenibacillus sediminis]|uniref:DNA replication protein n=1 Tax=Paenibacillus sediminis TaxID=664909 RepID=A0ABS4H0L2_9BACL|nr:DnaD domain-containing protein [Paenibacillus sediminis]MBP1935812.1 DNA replication protein [Paenibacillus sediminis]
MSSNAWNAWAKGVSYGLDAGYAIIPYALLQHYKQLKLTDSEVMLLIQLISFKQVEFNEFPTLEEIQHRMGGTANSIAGLLQKLMKQGLISIDEEWDEAAQIQYERYNFSGLYQQLSGILAEEAKAKQSAKRNAKQSLQPESTERNLFSIFETEFGRPLSPMEFETISGWLDQDKYPEELILMALKEAVFAGKVHFRYIDRILLEWSRNRVKTAEDAKAYTQKFRNLGR